MQSKYSPVKPPLISTAPRKQLWRIAPAKLAAKFRVEVAKQKEDWHTKKRQARSNIIIEHLEALGQRPNVSRRWGLQHSTQ